MNIKFLKIAQLTTFGITFFVTNEYAYSSTWYICAGGAWDKETCGYYDAPDGPNAYVPLGVRWSYSECKTFGDYVVTVPHESDVQSTTSDTWGSVCEVKPAGAKHSPAHTQGQKNKQPKGGKP